MSDDAAPASQPLTPQPPAAIYPELRSLRSSALKWYIASLAILGATLGLLTGMSSSPVVATILPLMFALIAGTGGFYSMNLKWTEAEDLAKLKYLGLAVLTFSLGVLIFGNIGIAVRTGRLPAWSAHKEDPNLLSTRDKLSVGLLDKKLELAGFADGERNEIHSSAIRDFQELRALVVREADLDLLLSAIQTAQSAYVKTEERWESLKKQSGPAEDTGVFGDRLRLRRTQFAGYARHLQDLKARLRSRQPVTWDHFKSVVDALTSTVESDMKAEIFVPDTKASKMPSEVDLSLAALFHLSYTIDLVTQGERRTKWLDRQPYQGLDEYLKLIVSSDRGIRQTPEGQKSRSFSYPPPP